VSRTPPAEDLPSIRLVELAKTGEEWATEELVRRYRERLLRWAHGRLPGWARGAIDTQDLVQDTLLKAIRNLPRFEAEGSGCFHCYLRAAIRNRLRDELVRATNVRRAGAPSTDLPAEEPSPLAVMIGSEMLDAYEAALQALPDADREAVVARVEFDQPYAQIAAALDLPSSDAARMKVKRAIARLAALMADARGVKPEISPG
jgi:RNA polymerase sigma-70 factor (ECF subfamily)